MNQSSTPVSTTAEVDGNTKQEPSTGPSKADLKALLAEARNTRDMLVGFRSAVESGTYAGVKMLDLAKGQAFLEAILNQNQAHIKNIQNQLGE